MGFLWVLLSFGEIRVRVWGERKEEGGDMSRGVVNVRESRGQKGLFVLKLK